MLRSVTEPVDETPSGELMDAVLAAMHRFENQLRGERTQGGMNYVYEGGIDQETYGEQLAQLSGDLDAAELDHQDAVIEDIDVDGIFHFAQHVLTGESASRVVQPRGLEPLTF